MSIRIAVVVSAFVFNWTNKDPTLHTVTSDNGAFQSSGDLGMSQSHPVTFMLPGRTPITATGTPT